METHKPKPLQPVYSGQFNRDLKLAKKRGKEIEKLKFLMNLIIDKKTLPSEYKDHPLSSNWRGFRDAHIEPDWLLIYKIEGNDVRFERTGKHTDIFER
ncbi:MAG: type II toxin-antitoxin system YafQ family toxin [Azoarcus sp.]|nr:type II toxin-antitoxin system YafQ family toxin [Azoarcus sp.]